MRKSIINLRNAFLVILVFTGFQANAQFSNTIRSGRPGQAIGPYTVGRSVLQFQQGMDFMKSEYGAEVTKTFIQNNVIRWGLTPVFELSAVLDYRTQKLVNSAVNRISGPDNLQLGFRYNIIDEPKNGIPGIGYQVRLKLPAGEKAFRAKNLGTIMILSLVHQMPEKFSLNTNWILNWDGIQPGPGFSYVINAGYSLSEKAGIFAEQYGTVKNNTFTPYTDGGFYFLLNPDLQLDLYGGFDLKNDIKEQFISVGISWRLKNRKVKKTL